MSWTDLFKDLGFGFQLGGAVSDVFQARSAARTSQFRERAQRQANEAQAQVAENNAQLATWQAQDALYRGAIEENRTRLNTAALKGTQRARMGANGIALDGDSASRVLTDTDVLGEIDALTQRDNAAREAWALRVQAQDSRDRAEFARRGYVQPGESTGSAVIGSLLSGGGRVARAWYDWSR